MYQEKGGDEAGDKYKETGVEDEDALRKLIDSGDDEDEDEDKPEDKEEEGEDGAEKKDKKDGGWTQTSCSTS